MSSRQDLEEFNKQGKPYPVYIVAAQGGGAYAAYHAASLLSSLQEECPLFTQHIFAISAVSGGSVGASLFNSIVRDAERNNAFVYPPSGCFEKQNGGPSLVGAVDTALRSDMWTPLQAALLLPDFIQRFIPTPVYRFDRALALEASVERMSEKLEKSPSYRKAFLKRKSASDRTLARPYMNHWDLAAFKHAPALLLNTTEVNTGNRHVISPFKFSGAGDLKFFGPTDMTTSAPREIPLSTAAILSARFPWVTPAGWLKGAGDVPTQWFVDGGYFENSGVSTAIDLIRHLDTFARREDFRHRVEFQLIILTSPNIRQSYLFAPGELLGPVWTLLNTRTARARNEIGRAIQLASRGAGAAGGPDKVVLVELLTSTDAYELPLGWRLSHLSRDVIQAQNGRNGTCEADDRERVLRGATCLRQLVRSQLKK